MKCDELTPIDLERNMGKDINGVEHREPWKAYDIDEVNEAIAELKAKLEKTIAERDGNQVCIDALKQWICHHKYKLCHHKYKRCLAMAQEWRNYAAFCGMQSSCHNHRGFGKTAEKYSWKECHAWKCVKRYKELAEKFKELKNAED